MGHFYIARFSQDGRSSIYVAKLFHKYFFSWDPNASHHYESRRQALKSTSGLKVCRYAVIEGFHPEILEANCDVLGNVVITGVLDTLAEI